MKKYCKNCSYLVDCSCWKTIVDNEFTGEEHILFYCKTNENGNCPHYKKKWYKFWIEDKK